MKSRLPFLLSLLVLGGLPVQMTCGREWSDQSGVYKLDAELIARNDATVVLMKPDKNLVMVDLNELSKADQEFVANAEHEAAASSGDAKQTWKLRNGMELIGTVVEYGRRDVTIQRKRGKVYVNDRAYKNLPDIYRRMIPKIVEYFEETELATDKAFSDWVVSLKGQPRTYTCEGVLMELPSGDLYGVPFFFLTAEDRNLLKPGWDAWVAAEDDAKSQADYQLALQAEAIARQRGRTAAQSMARLHLNLQAYDAGLFDLWEVTLAPPVGYPATVVVPARDSREAEAKARMRYPNAQVRGIAKARRQR